MCVCVCKNTHRDTPTREEYIYSDFVCLCVCVLKRSVSSGAAVKPARKIVVWEMEIRISDSK